METFSKTKLPIGFGALSNVQILSIRVITIHVTRPVRSWCTSIANRQTDRLTEYLR